MKVRALGALILAWGLAGSAVTSWAGGRIRLVCPPDRACLTVGRFNLVGVVEGAKVGWVIIEGVRTAEGGSVPVRDGAFQATCRLKRGLNRITVRAGDLKVVRRVFWLASPKDQARVPRGFRRYYLHAYVGRLSCAQCHRRGRTGPLARRVIPTPAGCTTGKCHAGLLRRRYAHGPVGARVCICCHSPHGSWLPRELEREGGDVCYACHQAKRRAFARRVVHRPVGAGDCVACHDPHGSSLRYQLKGKSLQDLCLQCHSRSLVKHRRLHGPVGAGDCVACHRPHASEFRRLLIQRESKGEVCFVCHRERRGDFARKHVHRPVAEGCTGCHDAHGSDFRGLLTQPQPALCWSCHRRLEPALFRAMGRFKHRHRPVDRQRCTTCHSPHSSDVRTQLRRPLQELCLGCHRDLRDYLRECRFKHGPVRNGDCDACHRPHGSRYPLLLNKFFPAEFYTPYGPHKYDLCFECHNRDIARDRRTVTLTDFRNGDLNLHYVHVHREKGRSCKACHDAHASSQPKHIRSEVPFGAWSYPIEFTKTATGGSCVVGCHRPLAYDRENPVRYR